jgi:hypothetical protein
MADTTFWLVWNPDGLRPPQHRHATESLAREEAGRLARLHPNSRFYVLRAICETHKSDLVTQELAAADEGVQF